MTMQLAAEKAVAHYFDANNYPIQMGRGTFEEIFLAQFRQMQPAQREVAKNRTLQRINADRTRRSALYGPQAVVDLRSQVPVAEQVTKLSLLNNLKISAGELMQLQHTAPSGAVIRGMPVTLLAIHQDVEPSQPVGSSQSTRLSQPGGPIPLPGSSFIDQKYRQLGGQAGFLGSPTGEEQWTPDRVGRYRHYQGGSIHWHPSTGAYETHGQIREKWQSLSWEVGFLGYPLTDELTTPDGKGRYNQFQGGSIRWYPDKGAYVASAQPISTLALRLVKLHCLDETGNPLLGGELGVDEMAIGGSMIDTDGQVTKISKMGLGDYEDNQWSKWSPKTLCALPVNQEDGAWPKTYIATLVLVESDGGSYTNFLNQLVDKLVPYVKNALRGVAIGKLGPTLGLIVGEISSYIAEKIFNLIKDVWNDDLFVPITVSMQIPGPGALFDNGAYDSPETWCWVKGHDGHYEYWVDWKVH